MTLLRSFSGSKPQPGEDRVGGGLLSLATDPFLDSGKALRGLVDVVPVGNVGKRFEQLFQALVARARRGGCGVPRSALRRAPDQPHFFDLSHPNAFPRGITPAVTQNPPGAN
jgi:hypothetical protein